MADLVSRLLEAITETERRENSRFVSTWEPGEMRLCPLCGRPVEELVESSAGDVDRTVVRPCGDLLVGDDLAAFWRRQSAADPAVLRRCTADKALIADLQTDRHRGDPWICESVLNPDGACDCGRDERVARRLTFLAEAYGLKVTE